MKAMLVKDGRLVLSEVAEPKVGADDVIVSIRAAALNRADLLQKKGTYPSPAGWPEWPGLECAGVVEAIGENARKNARFKVGDEVCALCGGGAYAEKIAVPYPLVMPIPKGLTFEEASALPEAMATSYLNLVWEGHLRPGGTVYVAAGASGLASAAIPLAKALGAHVVTDVINADNVPRVKALGAEEVIDLNKETVSEAFARWEAEGRPVSLALDCLAGEQLGKAIVHMAEGGHWVLISTLAGVETSLSLRPVLTRGLHLTGSMLRKRSVEEKGRLLAELTDAVWDKIAAGEIRPEIDCVLPFEKAEEAQGILERGENVGKVVLTFSKCSAENHP